MKAYKPTPVRGYGKYGITPAQYRRYLDSDEWTALRRRVLKRAKRQCEDCGAKACLLEVHHLTYERFGREELDDLRVVCQPCHSWRHKRRRMPKQLRARLQITAVRDATWDEQYGAIRRRLEIERTYRRKPLRHLAYGHKVKFA